MKDRALTLIGLAAALVVPLGAAPPNAQPGPAKGVEWAPRLGAALADAESEGRVVLLALGAAGEGRTAHHVKALYPAKDATAAFAATVNVPAWSFAPDDERELPKLSGVTPDDFRMNLAEITERWIAPNDSGAVPLPHHVWLDPKGEVLLSCPWEIDALELAWCTDEALRRAGIEARPDLPEGAHAPRRLVVGATTRVGDADPLGRGLVPGELDEEIGELNKRFLAWSDRFSVTRILFTDDDDAADFIAQKIGLWDIGQDATAGLLDGVIGLGGVLSTAAHVEMFEDAAKSNRKSRRAQGAVALENLGRPEGLAIAKKAWKKEKDSAVRAEWARALGACGRGQASIAKTLVRAAKKERDSRVRRGAILGLGHVLPEPSARSFLEDTVREGAGLEREAAILALALGREREARATVAAVRESGLDVEPSTADVVGAALEVLDGANLHVLEDDVARVSESELPRARLFFRASRGIELLRPR
ncbi:MAG: HEAT repeat domain-containing protein [Planctomycetota bacterium]